jgi:hypothetical protein
VGIEDIKIKKIAIVVKLFCYFKDCSNIALLVQIQ